MLHLLVVDDPPLLGAELVIVNSIPILEQFLKGFLDSFSGLIIPEKPLALTVEDF